MIPILLITLVALMYLLDLAVTLLNHRYSRRTLPRSAQGIYDPDQYSRWLNYSLDTLRFEVIVKTIFTLLLLILLGSGAFGWLERLTAGWFTGAGRATPILQTLSFLGLLGLAGMLLNLPFEAYETFVIEARHGFNKSTPRTFLLDFLKSMLLGAVLGGSLVTMLNILYLAFRGQLWLFILAAWLLLSAASVFLMLSTRQFVRLFNKLTPLPEGPFKERIQQLADRAGFTVKAISVMDASRRSTKLNAFFSGLGKTREVVLFDTLLEKLDEDEALAVLAHELGHAVHKDMPRMLAMQIVILGWYTALIGAILTSPTLAQSFGLSGVHFGFGMVLFAILAEPLGLLLAIPQNALSRRAEYAADAYAARMTAREPAMRMLIRLAQENLANLNPHPLYVLLHYSHPPIPQRLQAIERLILP